jgi:hypothetical protein
VCARFPDQVVVVRLDTVNRAFYALRKFHGAESWTRCEEGLELPASILLPDYSPRTTIILPDPVQQISVDQQITVYQAGDSSKSRYLS